MTPELQRVRAHRDALAPIFSALDLELVDDPAWAEPSGTSHLTDEARADPDIAANTAAMLETNLLIAWFGRDDVGWVGLWRGPSGRAVVDAPVVQLTTEGQYYLIGRTAADYLAAAMPEARFDEARDLLRAAGFSVADSRAEIQAALTSFDDPDEHCQARYRVHRATAGA